MKRRKRFGKNRVLLALPIAVAVVFAGALLVFGSYLVGVGSSGVRMSAVANIVDQWGNIYGDVPLRGGSSSPLSFLFIYGDTTLDITQHISPGNANLRYIMVKPVVEVRVQGYDPNNPPMVRVVWSWTSFTFNGTPVPVKSAQLMSADYPIGTEYQDWSGEFNAPRVLEGEGFAVFIPLDSNVFNLQPGQTGQLVMRCSVIAELRDRSDITMVLDSKSATGEFVATLKNTG